MTNLPKILLILTGGTICSTENTQGKRCSNARDVKITEHFQNGQSPYAKAVDFDAVMPLDILSENMTADCWNTLLREFKKTDFSQYKGIIILHGTDTLAYTASMLSASLCGIDIPVIMVSSQLPLNDKNTNGHDNFRAAVELVINGIKPNVYAVYKNSDGHTYVHFGAHLEQCKNFTSDFFSADATKIGDIKNAAFEGVAFEADTKYFKKMQPLSDNVLIITPYVGINYDRISLDGVRAVVHNTYHSESVCVGDNKPSPSSVLSLIDRCKGKDIPLFLAPCAKDSSCYESTQIAISHGADYIENVTLEMAYAKVMIAAALGLDNEGMCDFVNKSINWEKIPHQ